MTDEAIQVLLVEDNPTDALIVEEVLMQVTGVEFVVKRVERLAEAFRELTTQHFGVVLLDLGLPDSNGFETFVRLREVAADVPIVVLSGQADEVLAVRAVQAGAQDYIVKAHMEERVLARAIRYAIGRKQSEEHIRNERALLRSLIDSIPDLIFYKNKDSIFLGCNKAFEKHLGITEEKLIGLTDFDIVPQEVAEHYRRNDQYTLDSGETLAAEDWIPSKDGEGGYFETVKTPYFGPQGESLGLIGVSRDITARKKAQERLDLLDICIENLNDIILVTEAARLDEPGPKIVFANKALERITGYTIAEVIGQSPRFLQGEKTDRHVLDEMREAFVKQQPIRRQVLNYGKDGTEYWLDIDVVPVFDPSGKCTHFAAIERDITEERSREDKLAAALMREKELSREAQAGNRAKSEFLAVMSHEIRTPMNAILGFSDLLAHYADLPSDCHDYVQTISSSGEALLRILNDVLDYSRLEANGMKIDKKSFSPREVLQDVHTLLAPHASEKGLLFELSIGEDVPPWLHNDAGRLRQILVNLSSNAIKFTEHGSVTLGLRVEKASDGCSATMEYFVADTGSGIPADRMEEIFRPFTQLDSRISRPTGGTGLGLSISRNLVHLMEGTLTVHCPPGGGSEFRVRFPYVPARVAAGGSPALSQYKLNDTFALSYPLRILLVEDDFINRKLMMIMLRKLGYEALVAKDGIEAVEMYRSESPDCILMDLQMPRKDGFEATSEIRKIELQDSSLPPVFISALTANTVTEDRQRCFDEGMDAYLSKPVNLAQIAKTLAQVIR
ncbi:MAG: response regulator [Chthoniobacterales bacterium]